MIWADRGLFTGSDLVIHPVRGVSSGGGRALGPRDARSCKCRTPLRERQQPDTRPHPRRRSVVAGHRERRPGETVDTGVTDPDPRALPVLVGAVGSEAESGRGPALLDALAVRWGVEQEADRKTVWCELFTDAEAVAPVGTPGNARVPRSAWVAGRGTRSRFGTFVSPRSGPRRSGREWACRRRDPSGRTEGGDGPGTPHAVVRAPPVGSAAGRDDVAGQGSLGSGRPRSTGVGLSPGAAPARGTGPTAPSACARRRC